MTTLVAQVPPPPPPPPLNPPLQAIQAFVTPNEVGSNPTPGCDS